MKQQTLDRIGIAASTLCAIHCAAVPLLGALLGVGVGMFGGEHAWHTAFVYGTILFGLASMVVGIMRHGDYRALIFVAIAAVLGVGAEASHELLEARPFMHGAVFAAMGILMIVGHVLNIKLLHGHIHDSECDHDH